MNKRITLNGTHGDRLTIIFGKKDVSFNAYTDGSSFVVSIPKEKLKEELEK
jgi:hypothetical protein